MMSQAPPGGVAGARIFAFLIKAAADEAPAGRSGSSPGGGPPSGLRRDGTTAGSR